MGRPTRRGTKSTWSNATASPPFNESPRAEPNAAAELLAETPNLPAKLETPKEEPQASIAAPEVADASVPSTSAEPSQASETAENVNPKPVNQKPKKKAPAKEKKKAMTTGKVQKQKKRKKPKDDDWSDDDFFDEEEYANSVVRVPRDVPKTVYEFPDENIPEGLTADMKTKTGPKLKWQEDSNLCEVALFHETYRWRHVFAKRREFEGLSDEEKAKILEEHRESTISVQNNELSVSHTL
ncbi:hypothetical protein L596_024359 [Steinernema carpocapsae]|uniref:Uncharacterized protein n=1 Tax=Steinernema carpocapsae TaxID=34508 RepID=A0A4U5MGJ0_STECR|nr:hypothetical protein L596_024359 [Steinernema carpocapsae]